jgi:hypothetical protein
MNVRCELSFWTELRGELCDIDFPSHAGNNSVANLSRILVFAVFQIAENGFLLADAANGSMLACETVQEVLVFLLFLAPALARDLRERFLDSPRDRVGGKRTLIVCEFGRI